MKAIIKATSALFFFKPYTTYSRWFEIGLGIIAWCCMFLIFYAALKN